MNDHVAAWARAVVARVGLPLDRWAVIATLEAEGLRDDDARARFGHADLFGFAQGVYGHAVTIAPRPAPPEPLVRSPAARLRALRRHLVDGVFFSLPVAAQVGCSLALGHSLFSSLGFDVRDAAVVGLATAASAVTTGASALAVSHQATAHFDARDVPQALRALVGAVVVAAALSVAVLAAAAAAWLVRPAVTSVALAWFGAHYASFAALWIALALLYALRLRWWVVGVSLAGALAVNGLVRGAGLRPHAALVAGAVAAAALAFALVAGEARRLAHAPPGPSAARVRDDFRAGALLPHLAYTAGYFALVSADRVLLWTADHATATLVSRYELGMSWAFATFVAPMALAEHLAAEFHDGVEAAQRTATVASIDGLRARARAALARSTALLALVGAANVGLVWIAGRALAARRPDLPVDPLTVTVFLCGSAAYQLLVSGLFVGLLHLVYARRAQPARALWRALLVGTVCGLALTRALGPAWALAAFVVGVVAFAAQMIPAGVRLCARIDHAHYAAY